MAEETKKEPAQTCSKGRLAARIFFYLGIVSIILGLSLRYVCTSSCPYLPSPHTLILITIVWFGLSATIMLAEIEKKLDKK